MLKYPPLRLWRVFCRVARQKKILVDNVNEDLIGHNSPATSTNNLFYHKKAEQGDQKVA